MTAPEAYCASIAVDDHDAEVVGRTRVVTGFMPKDVFRRRR